MTNLDITLTLSEYVRRMSSADAREWLPGPSETVVLFWPLGYGVGTPRRVDLINQLGPNVGFAIRCPGHWPLAKGVTQASWYEEVTVSRIPY